MKTFLNTLIGSKANQVSNNAPSSISKMHKLLIKVAVFVLLGNVPLVQGQIFDYERPDEIRFQVPTDGDTSAHQVFTLFNNVIVRQGSYLDSERIGMVEIGAALDLLEESENVTELNGVQSPWYKCHVNGVEGWIWGGNFAIGREVSKKDPEVVFLTGFQSRLKEVTEEDYAYTKSILQVRVVKNSILLDKTLFTGIEDFPLAYTENMGKKGLQNVNDILMISSACEYCGCSGEDHYFSWDGGQLNKMKDTQFSPDADYSTGTYLIFPDDEEGSAGVIKVMNESFDQTFVSETAMKKDLYQTDYKWTGDKMVALGFRKKISSVILR